jgi:RHS repeat-associated protein
MTLRTEPFFHSTTATATATATIPAVAEPAFNPGGGNYASSNPITVTITTTTPGANIRYTVDGTNPTQSYGTLIAASSGTASVTPAFYTHPTQLKAVAFKSGYTASAVHGESYSVGDPSSDPCYPVAYPGCDQGGSTDSAMRGGDISMMADMESDSTETNDPAPIAVYLYAGDQIIENVTTGYLYFQDSLGNTSHVTDAAGNLKESYTYSAFGTPYFYYPNDPTNNPHTASAIGIQHLFQGQLWRQETGLNDYRNRVELPAMGVFLQPDPIGFKGDAANVYRFCNNNAVNRTDPMGLFDNLHARNAQGNLRHDISKNPELMKMMTPSAIERAIRDVKPLEDPRPHYLGY